MTDEMPTYKSISCFDLSSQIKTVFHQQLQMYMPVWMKSDLTPKLIMVYLDEVCFSFDTISCQCG